MTCGPRKKPFEILGENSDRITLGSGLPLGGGTAVLHVGDVCYPQHLFNSNNFATPAVFAEVCALMSVITLRAS